MHKSVTGIDGTYTEITADGAQSAEIVGTEVGPFSVNGKTIDFQVDGGATQSVTISAPNPSSTDAIVSFLNGELSDAVAANDSEYLKLSSVDTGTDSSIEIIDGTSLTDLGFTIGDSDIGEDDRITLVADTENYVYDDLNGDEDYYYKVRYYNSISGAYSTFGDPIKGDIGSIVSSTDRLN
ncbi:MAG: hypothetical protein ACXAEU_19825 [Candidatus Hodarchaeales archaeon]